MARLHRHWLIAGLLLFAWCFFVNVAHGFSMPENWFLQVVSRFSHGDVLYRDVFLGVTPLSVYITAAFTTTLGSEIWVVKVVGTLCFVLTILLCCRITRQAGSDQACPLLLVLFLLVYAQHPLLYTPLSILFLLACVSAFLSWRESWRAGGEETARWGRPAGTLAMAGVAAGLCFATKQNVGAYVLLALLLAVVMRSQETAASRQGLVTSIFVVFFAFFLTCLVVLLPVWLSGGTDKLLEYGFVGKGTYVRLGQVSYSRGLEALGGAIQGPWSTRKLWRVYTNVPFLLPFLTFPALLLAWFYSPRGQRQLSLAMLCFVGAGFLGIFPRADRAHMRYVTPALLLGLACAWYQLRPFVPAQWAHLLKMGGYLWTGVGLGYLLVTPFVWLASGTYEVSNLPHFRHVLVRKAWQAQVRSEARTLVEATGGDPILLLTPQAGFYYLVSGLTNPTSYDAPLVTTFGRYGEAELIGAISQGRIRWVCLDTQTREPLMSGRLRRYVQEKLEPTRDIGVCTLYRSPP